MKKIFLGAFTAALTTASIVSVVSCGKTHEKSSSDFNIYSENITSNNFSNVLEKVNDDIINELKKSDLVGSVSWIELKVIKSPEMENEYIWGYSNNHDKIDSIKHDNNILKMGFNLDFNFNRSDFVGGDDERILKLGKYQESLSLFKRYTTYLAKIYQHSLPNVKIMLLSKLNYKDATGQSAQNALAFGFGSINSVNPEILDGEFSFVHGIRPYFDSKYGTESLSSININKS